MKVLDLFCGAGGAAKGYFDAFGPDTQIWGYDIIDQPRYPYNFIQTDVMELELLWNPWLLDWDGFDFIHASPPCQRYSIASNCRPGLSENYPDLIALVRELLERTNKPYVIENVVGAPLVNPQMLCGQMVGLDLIRHRNFETNWGFVAPDHVKHSMPGSKAGASADKGGWKPGRIISVAGNCAPIAEARRAMGIDWMRRDELTEAIPPAYTKFIGEQFLART